MDPAKLYSNPYIKYTAAKKIDSYGHIDLGTAILSPVRTEVDKVRSLVENSASEQSNDFAAIIRKVGNQERKVCN